MTFVFGYAPTDTQSVGEKHALWTALERVVKEVSGHEQLFALKDANARQIYSHELERQNPLAECYCAPQPPFLPISDHNIIPPHVEPVGRFGHNQPVRRAKGPPPIDRRRLTNDPHLGQEVATVIGVHLGAFPPCGSSDGDGDTAFTTDILQTAQRIGLLQAPRLPGRGWRGDTQAEAETSLAMVTRRAF